MEPRLGNVAPDMSRVDWDKIVGQGNPDNWLSSLQSGMQAYESLTGRDSRKDIGKGLDWASTGIKDMFSKPEGDPNSDLMKARDDAPRVGSAVDPDNTLMSEVRTWTPNMMLGWNLHTSKDNLTPEQVKNVQTSQTINELIEQAADRKAYDELPNLETVDSELLNNSETADSKSPNNSETADFDVMKSEYKDALKRYTKERTPSSRSEVVRLAKALGWW